jgi:hypothetical protein
MIHRDKEKVIAMYTAKGQYKALEYSITRRGQTFMTYHHLHSIQKKPGNFITTVKMYHKIRNLLWWWKIYTKIDTKVLTKVIKYLTKISDWMNVLIHTFNAFLILVLLPWLPLADQTSSE